MATNDGLVTTDALHVVSPRISGTYDGGFPEPYSRLLGGWVNSLT